MSYPPLREAVTDPKTGIITRPWGLFVQDINNFLSVLQQITNNGDVTTISALGDLILGALASAKSAGATPTVAFPSGFAFLGGPILFDPSTYVKKTLVGAASPAVLTVPPDTCIVLELFTAASGASLAGIRSEYVDPPVYWRLLVLVNGSAQSITLVHASAAAAEDERFAFPGSANYTLAAGQVLALLWHPNTTA